MRVTQGADITWNSCEAKLVTTLFLKSRRNHVLVIPTMVSKRENTLPYGEGKKVKLDEKKEDIAIDLELLGDQLLYANNELKDDEGVSGSLVSDADTANAAAAALSHQQQPHHHAHHAHQQQHQLQQRLAYENQHYHHVHALDLSLLQPTTLPPVLLLKPPHGLDEWHRVRRENHKEVERRRRELINQGIKELAALIPTPDTNKAQILQRAVEFIKRLKENENNNIEKWTLEKLLTEQAVTELNALNEKLKQELERAYREIESLRRQVEDK